MLRRLSALSMLLFVLVASAMAQFSGMQLPNIEYNPVLLINAAVQKELKLSPANAAKVQNAFMEEAMKIMPLVSGNGANGKPLPPAQRTKAMLAGVTTMQNRLAAMLTPGQRQRLRQLTLQSIGPSAVLQPKVATALGLTSSQKSTLTSALAQANRKVANGSMQGSNQRDWQVRLNQMSQLQAQAKAAGNVALNRTLTGAQKAKWNALLGKPFPLKGFLGMGNTLPMGG